ncbi:uncharacterized protein PAC_06707 [Phialocephala subalpina]|uniref:Uncharacterized protein n=1 Tax=Phialocephala subalpina TaxID=576137 RepID=A0A1L7WVM4_9HELO|nr:uncharacterized protein PAC_06707 [Phialocephala subalpina]
MRSTALLTVLANAASVLGQFNMSGLGPAYQFGCLSLSGITNTGLTTITGDMGAAINPLLASSITGFPPGISVSLADATTAFTTVTTLTNPTIFTGELGGLTSTPSVHKFLSFAQLTTALTLLGTGSSADAWYFQIGSTLVHCFRLKGCNER